VLVYTELLLYQVDEYVLPLINQGRSMLSSLSEQTSDVEVWSATAPSSRASQHTAPFSETLH
jgi:hypothetical protein